jgi:hypothetical protein
MDKNTIITSWPHNWYGIWLGTFHDEDNSEDFPAVEPAIDISWCPEDKSRLISYLSSCTCVGAASAPDRVGVPLRSLPWPNLGLSIEKALSSVLAQRN